MNYGCRTVDLEHEMFQKMNLKITGACPIFGSFFVELLIYESTCMLNTLHIFKLYMKKYMMTRGRC